MSSASKLNERIAVVQNLLPVKEEMGDANTVQWLIDAECSYFLLAHRQTQASLFIHFCPHLSGPSLTSPLCGFLYGWALCKTLIHVSSESVAVLLFIKLDIMFVDKLIV